MDTKTTHSRFGKQLAALLRSAKVTGDDQVQVIRGVLRRRDTESINALNDIELRHIVDTLDYWKRTGQLASRCQLILARKANEDDGN